MEDIRAMISARIREGFYSADPHSREQWRRIPHEEVPTQEEWCGMPWKGWKPMGARIYLDGILIFRGAHFESARDTIDCGRK